MIDTADVKVIGIVLDIGQKHGSNGCRNLENVKKSLVSFVKSYMDDDDVLYLYKENSIDIVDRVGAQVGLISNFRSEGWKFELINALKQTLFVVARESYKDKVVLLISDRISDDSVLKKIHLCNKKDNLECRLICVNIGNTLNSTEYFELEKVDDSANMKCFKEIIYGQRQSLSI